MSFERTTGGTANGSDLFGTAVTVAPSEAVVQPAVGDRLRTALEVASPAAYAVVLCAIAAVGVQHGDRVQPIADVAPALPVESPDSLNVLDTPALVEVPDPSRSRQVVKVEVEPGDTLGGAIAALGLHDLYDHDGRQGQIARAKAANGIEDTDSVQPGSYSLPVNGQELADIALHQMHDVSGGNPSR